MVHKDSPTYNFKLDIIRVLSIFCVVLVHVVHGVSSNLSYFGNISWWIAIILDSTARIAIPLFIMISGYLILAKDESFEQSIKRAVARILIPFLFWIVFYTWWDGGNATIANIDGNFLLRIFSINVYHLYFLIIMFGLYCVAPIIRAFLQKATATSKIYFLEFLLFIGIVYAGLQFLFIRCTSENAFTIWIPYAGLFVAGYLLGNYSKDHKKTLPVFGLYLCALGATIFLNYYHAFANLHNTIFLDSPGCISYYSDFYLSINVVIASLCAFSLLLKVRYTFLEHSFMRTFIHMLARCSLGIYVVHLFIMQFIDSRLHLFNTVSPLFVMIFLKWIVVLLLSFLVAYMGIKIPIIKRVFGEGK